jgi:hypothetical protein
MLQQKLLKQIFPIICLRCIFANQFGAQKIIPVKGKGCEVGAKKGSLAGVSFSAYIKLLGLRFIIY